MKFIKIFIMISFFACSKNAIAQNTFSNLDELLSFVKTKSITLQQGDIKITQAKKAKLAAIIGVLDPTNVNSFTVNNNLRQQVLVVPSEAFGGTPGGFNELTIGTKYVNTLNVNLDIKLINLAGWENLKLAKINIQKNEVDNKLNEKILNENIASAYYNIINIQEQIKQNEQNLKSATTLLKTSENKYALGLVKQQDVNDTKASFLTTEENNKQLLFLEKQNILSLKILCDIPENETIEIKNNGSTINQEKPSITFNELNFKSNELKEKYALSNYRQNKASLLPTASFVFSNNVQQNTSNFELFDSSVKWINSYYVGLKLSFGLPTAKSISQVYNAKFDYQLAQKNSEQSKIKSEIEYKQLNVDFDKAISQAKANDEIFKLRKDTYDKNQKLYSEGLIGIDQTLNSYNAMVNANYNAISSLINIQLAQSRIDINNKIN
jgi:outer membrane protein TolC